MKASRRCQADDDSRRRVGGGLASALGGGAAKSIGTSALLKGAATVAVVGAIGVGAADRGGLIHVPVPGGSEAKPSQIQQPTAGDGPAVRGIQAAGPDAADRGSAAAPGSARLGAAQGTKAANQAADHPGGNAEGGRTASADLAPSHPHGRDHEKQHPSAAAHGQQTAATHKAANHGSSGSKSQPAHPVEPVHPAKPSSPGPEREVTSTSAGAPSSETHSAAATEQSAGPEEIPPGQGSGKKP
jgi:hypothetical protein